MDINLAVLIDGDNIPSAHVKEMMEEIAKYGNIASKSDIEVGARALETGIWGAYKNVMINMQGVKDEKYKKSIVKLAEDINLKGTNQCKKVLDILETRN